MNTYNTTGGKIRLLIDKLGIKDKEFAALINTTPQTLSKILNDKYPLSQKMAKRIANALNTTEEFLLYNEDDLDTQKEPDYCAQENIDTNRLYFRISHAVSLLTSFGYDFIEKISFQSEVYTRHNNDLKYATSTTSAQTFTEAEIIDLINAADSIPRRTVEIKFNSTILELDYCDYIKWICNVIDAARLSACQQISASMNQASCLDDIAKMIDTKQSKMEGEPLHGKLQ